MPHDTPDPAAPAAADTAVPSQTAEEPAATPNDPAADATAGLKGPKQPPGEIGGPAGPEPTRYGDWEVGGRCTDF
ncbi:MAG: DUF1674 domain-containing protein [Rhodospirillaceae bacterium]|nr:DUF1674 domain-containing protein [Rhodospirillaceae bacterium]